MKLAVLAVLAVAALPVASASAEGTCTSNAADKHLAGAALTSFMGKCGRDARTSCEGLANARKLSGAARVSFSNKCMRDSIGG